MINIQSGTWESIVVKGEIVDYKQFFLPQNVQKKVCFKAQKNYAGEKYLNVLPYIFICYKS